MKSAIYSLILFCLLASAASSQPSFQSIDTLLIKNFEAVSLKDSAYYLSLLNLKKIMPSKGIRNRSDSLKVLKPFTDAFSDMAAELREFAGTDDVEVKYESYSSGNTSYYDTRATGKLLIHVNLLINNTFTVKVPFVIMADKGMFTIEHPMMVMFAE